MERRRPTPWALGVGVLGALFSACGVSACGGGGIQRPFVVDTFPANQEVLSEGLGAVRITWNENVRILNPGDVDVRLGDFLIPIEILQRPEEPRSVYVRPVSGAFFPPETFIVVHVVEGIVVNADDHYAEDEYVFGFTTGPTAPIWTGEAGQVTSLDAETLAPVTSVPTGLVDPVGILDLDPGSGRRVWVQLANGGGSGAALASFAPGAVAMTPLMLSTLGGGDLTATHRTLVPDPWGRLLYAAFRDEGDQTVRCFRIDLLTQTETAAVTLSIPASASTAPLGLDLDPHQGLLIVSCADGATGQVAFVDLVSFVEEDRDPVALGIQAFPLPFGAGPLATVSDQSLVAPPGTDDGVFVRTGSNGILAHDSGLTGTSVDVLRTWDGVFLLQPLAGYASDQAIVARTIGAGYLNPFPLTVSDDVGAGPTGSTSVAAMGPYPFDNRFLVMLDNAVATRWVWNGFGFFQEDLDGAVDGLQGADLSGTDIHVIGRALGVFPLPAAP